VRRDDGAGEEVGGGNWITLSKKATKSQVLKHLTQIEIYTTVYSNYGLLMQIKFENFRGIKKSDFIPIRPITLFVGENSSGKTSVFAIKH